MSVETSRDWNGRYWIGHAKGCSMFFRDPKELKRFLKLPVGTPSRASLDSWLVSLEASPAAPASDPATSFDPLAHGLDESDPNHQTRTII